MHVSWLPDENVHPRCYNIFSHGTIGTVVMLLLCDVPTHSLKNWATVAGIYIKDLMQNIRNG